MLPQASCALSRGALRSVDSPPNDDFANAVTVSGSSFVITGTTEGATAETDEPLFDGDQPQHSVWYRWTSDRSGQVIIDSKGSLSDAKIAVYTGSRLAGLHLLSISSSIATSGDYIYEGEPEMNRVDFGVTSGKTYFIDVDSVSGLSGAFTLRVNPADPLYASCSASSAQHPSNDDFAQAISITSPELRTSVTGTTTGATTEPWDPQLLRVGSTVWYRWKAPTSEYVSFDVWQTDPSSFGSEHNDRSPFIAVFKGESLRELQNVNDYHDSYGDSLVSSFRAIAGNTYYIEVVGLCSHRGTFKLRIVRQQRRNNKWLRALNYYRSLAHLSPVTENPLFSYADFLHARYAEKTRTFAHEENRSSRYFTYDGAIGGRSSNGYSGLSGVSAISGWMSTPYHTTPILNPALRTIGYYSMGTSWLFVYGEMTSDSPSEYPVLWPGRNVTEPLVAYAGNESPDPLLHCKGYGDVVGLPIVARFDDATKLRGSNFQSGGKRLARCTFQPQSDVVFLIPKAPLKRGRTYTVTLVMSSGTVKWSFRVSRTIPSLLR